MTEAIHVVGVKNQWRTYIVADGQIVGQRLVTTISGNSTIDLKYFIADHLGSIAIVLDGTVGNPTYGQVTERDSYDAWGKARNADGTPDTTCSKPGQSVTTRGFTGQEQIPSLCLVNLNARLYDPQLGRFMVADPSSGSGLNRYWYVADNPLSLTDPSGLCFLGCFWKSPTGKAAIGIVIAFVIAGVVLPELEAGVSVFSTGGLSSLSASQLALNAGIAGGVAGGVTSGRFSGAVMGALEAIAFNIAGTAVGNDPDAGFFSAHTGQEFLAHGLVGGLFSAGQKGGIGAGFLAAGFGSLADSAEMPGRDPGAFAFNTIEHAAAGGLGSLLGGGKFADGALTGAFGYLFNCVSHPGSCTPGDAPAVRKEMSDCLDKGLSASCFEPAKLDAEQSGIMPMADPAKVLPQFGALTVGTGAAFAAGATCIGTGACEVALSGARKVADPFLRLYVLIIKMITGEPDEIAPLPELPSKTEMHPEFSGRPTPWPQTTSEPVPPPK